MHRRGPGERLIPRARDARRCAHHKIVAVAAYCIWTLCFEKTQTSGHGKPGREVASPRPVEFLGQALAVAMRDGEWMKLRLAFFARPKESAASRCEEPFVAVARVPVRAKCRNIYIELARRMGTVDEYRDFALAGDR